MGCDIHLAVEVQTVDGWERAEMQEPNPYAQYEDEPALIRPSWYTSRNYNLFAMLADVRNGRGFAGIDTGNRIDPISLPKGLPSDVSAEVKAGSDRYGDDGHSHSFFTLKELLDVPWWDNKITNRGWFDIPERDQGDPDAWIKRTVYRLERGWETDGWSGGAYGDRIVAKHLNGAITVGGTDRLSGGAVLTTKTPTIYQIEWTTSWAVCCDKEWFEALARMAAEASRRGLTTKGVRAVFWFDN